jgi:hypothetical protein
VAERSARRLFVCTPGPQFLTTAPGILNRCGSRGPLHKLAAGEAGIGQAAFVHLKRLRHTIKSPEAQRRLNQLLAGFDAV